MYNITFTNGNTKLVFAESYQIHPENLVVIFYNTNNGDRTFVCIAVLKNINIIEVVDDDFSEKDE